MSRRITGLAAIADPTARVLILGSMPGEASLAAGQYYAHPRNAFWWIVGSLLDIRPDAAYEQRADALRAAGIAVWDVVHSCHRQGSLDSAIDAASIRMNDFRTFFTNHPHIELTCFNGTAAERLFRTRALPGIGVIAPRLLRLPSTSPAHAARSAEAKLREWRTAIAAALPLRQAASRPAITALAVLAKPGPGRGR